MTPKFKTTHNTIVTNPNPCYDNTNRFYSNKWGILISIYARLPVAHCRNAAHVNWRGVCQGASRRQNSQKVQLLEVWNTVSVKTCCKYNTVTDFYVRSTQNIVNQAVLEVSDRMLYDVEKMRRPVQHGALDSRLVRLREAWYTEAILADFGLLLRELQAKLDYVIPAAKDFTIAMVISAMSG